MHARRLSSKARRRCWMNWPVLHSLVHRLYVWNLKLNIGRTDNRFAKCLYYNIIRYIWRFLIGYLSSSLSPLYHAPTRFDKLSCIAMISNPYLLLCIAMGGMGYSTSVAPTRLERLSCIAPSAPCEMPTSWSA